MMDNRKNKYFGVGLFNPKTPENVGSALRAVGVFQGSFVFYSGMRMKKLKCRTDTMNHIQKLPLTFAVDLHKVIPYDCCPIAIDLNIGGKSLVDFKHPPRAFYIFGPEDGTLEKAVTEWCADSVYIPSNGCLNLAAAVNVVLYDRTAKDLENKT